jgi:hypothetical protein
LRQGAYNQTDFGRLASNSGHLIRHADTNSSMIDQDFEISSVLPMKPPKDSEGSEWHSYTITRGDNTIRGFREGSLSSVTEAAEVIVTQLNERRMGKRARAQLVIPSSKKS